MARKRMIDPNIWDSQDFSKLSVLARIIFIGMFSLADDYGKGRAKPVYLKSSIFPYDEAIRIIDVEKALSEIGTNMSVTFYSHDGNDYYKLNNWKKWQKVERPSDSVIPEPIDEECVDNYDENSFDDCSTNVRRTFSPNIKEENIREEKIKEKKEKPPISPKGDEVSALFESFWAVYPKRVSKSNAAKAFAKIKPDDDLLAVMISAVEKQKQSDQWQKDSGQYIPHPATWLNQRRWEDELEQKTQEEIYAEFGIKPFVLGVDDL